MSTCSGLRLALFLKTMFPAEEKRRSEGADMAGTCKISQEKPEKEIMPHLIFTTAKDLYF